MTWKLVENELSLMAAIVSELNRSELKSKCLAAPEAIAAIANQPRAAACGAATGLGISQCGPSLPDEFLFCGRQVVVVREDQAPVIECDRHRCTGAQSRPTEPRSMTMSW